MPSDPSLSAAGPTPDDERPSPDPKHHHYYEPMAYPGRRVCLECSDFENGHLVDWPCPIKRPAPASFIAAGAGISAQVYCGNDHSKPRKALARVTFPTGRYHPLTACRPCLRAIVVGDALDEAGSVLIERIERD